jgi:predicted transcriptional regulator
MLKRVTTTVRLSASAKELLERLSELHCLSHSAIMEMALREKAKRDKVLPERGVFPQLVAPGARDGTL